MILADTSVWVDHLSRGNEVLQANLRRNEIVTHPFVCGELACGSIKDRARVLTLLRALPAATVAESDEVFVLIETNRLWGLGLGWTDVNILASALISRVRLWTFDKQLALAAQHLKVGV